MLGEREAVILEARPFDVHGVPHIDVSLTFSDQASGKVVTTARLGAESAPPDLAPGDRVIVSLAMNMVVAIRRA